MGADLQIRESIATFHHQAVHQCAMFFVGKVWAQPKLATMGRPQLSVGTAGSVRTYPEGNGFRATTIYRDYDRRNRRIERHAKTKGAAQRALAEAVRDRGRTAQNSAMSPGTKVTVLAEAW